MNILLLNNFNHKQNIGGVLIRLAFTLLFISLAQVTYSEENEEHSDQKIFTVKNINIYAEGETLEEATDKALRAGSIEALDKLLSNIIVYDERHKSSSIINRTNAYDFVNYTEIESERMTSHSYKATITYKFNHKKIRNLLNSSGIKYVGRTVQNALLIPILHSKGGSITIWSNDDWRNAWDETSLKVGLMNYILSEGDLIDIGALNPKEIMSAPLEKYTSILKDYESESLIAIFSTELDNKLDITIRFLNPTNNYYRYTSLLRNKDESEKEFYKRAAHELTIKIDADWKGEKVFDNERYYSSKLIVKYNKPAGWMKIKKDLEEIKEILQIKLLNKSATEAEIEIIYTLPPAIFSNELLYKGYALKKTEGQIHLVSR
ncbi:hypothetical protein I862_03285 [endosymbiont of Acanthamoeba sp. UWC8]|uniref:DUF2066 domain-containing protein n=1 Tax=endosymbiont of Acanthamoeba sp. UWC8 TaxID=86106 RepID=UPI0004D1CA96|nr:DUF2066 domain-containing protein [endosymbiont of Acanthamoeba sp. UWC8]AIF81217.1 hypothetical protein I862_03285 [endosymbiont of Acanthamoeba sp. UWC8]